MGVEAHIKELEIEGENRFEINSEYIEPFRISGDVTIEALINHIKEARKEATKKQYEVMKKEKEIKKQFSQVP